MMDRSELVSEIAGQPQATPLPLLEAKRVYISKEHVLRQALESLSLEIHECRACAVGNNQILGSVCIAAPARGQYSVLHGKKIFGDYKLTEEDALESARLAALPYLQKIGIISVDDVNLSDLGRCQAELSDCQRKLLAASNWATMFQEQAESLKAKLAIVYQENEDLVAAAKVVHVKNELSMAQTTEVKKEESYLEEFVVTKIVSTPPSSGQAGSVRLLQGKKRSASDKTDVKKVLFKTCMATGSKTQDITSEEKKI